MTCTHGQGEVTGVRYGLVPVHGWLFTSMRCWHCDLNVRLGFRWRYPTVGSALTEYYRVR